MCSEDILKEEVTELTGMLSLMLDETSINGNHDARFRNSVNTLCVFVGSSFE